MSRFEVKAREVEEFARRTGADKTKYWKANKKTILGQAQHEMDAAKRRKK